MLREAFDDRIPEVRIATERNLQWLPVHNLSRGVGRKQTGIDVRETYTTAEGEEAEGLWQVRGDYELGLPGAFEGDVLMGVEALVDDQGGLDSKGGVDFSTYALLKRLGACINAKYYDMVGLALRRWARIRIYSQWSFVEGSHNRRVEKDFGLWKLVRIEVRDGSGRVRENNRVEFDEMFVDSYRANYVDLMDLDFYKRLKYPKSKRLYRLLNHKCDEQGVWEVDVRLLGEVMPLPRNRPGKLVEVLKGAHTELRERGYLDSVELVWEGRTIKAVRYRLARSFARRRRFETIRQIDGGPQALELLGAVGLSKVADRLVRDHGISKCSEMAKQTLDAVAGGARIDSAAALCRWNLNENEVFMLPASATPKQTSTGKRKPDEERAGKGNNQEGGAKSRADYDWFFGDNRESDAERERRADEREEAAKRRKEDYEWLFDDEGQSERENGAS